MDEFANVHLIKMNGSGGAWIDFDKDGDIDKSAASHNVLMVSGEPAYPENRAYYSKEFKEFINMHRKIWKKI